MKNIVIAAGYATRLGALTANYPKPLLKIGEKSILERMLDDIDQILDITEHVIISNHKFAHHFEEWKNSLPLREDGGSHYTKKITVIDDGTSTNETRLGAVCDLLLAIEMLDKRPLDLTKRIWTADEIKSLPLREVGGSDDLLVVAADNLLFFSFQGFVDFAKEKGTPCIMCHEQPVKEKLQRTGVVVLDENNKVLNMEEKPHEPKSTWAVPPFYIYKKENINMIMHAIENGCGFDAPGNLAHYMVDNVPMHAWPMAGTGENLRFDIGSLDTYHEACAKYGKDPLNLP